MSKSDQIKRLQENSVALRARLGAARAKIEWHMEERARLVSQVTALLKERDDALAQAAAGPGPEVQDRNATITRLRNEFRSMRVNRDLYRGMVGEQREKVRNLTLEVERLTKENQRLTLEKGDLKRNLNNAVVSRGAEREAKERAESAAQTLRQELAWTKRALNAERVSKGKSAYKTTVDLAEENEALKRRMSRAAIKMGKVMDDLTEEGV